MTFISKGQHQKQIVEFENRNRKTNVTKEMLFKHFGHILSKYNISEKSLVHNAEINQIIKLVNETNENILDVLETHDGTFSIDMNCVEDKLVNYGLDSFFKLKKSITLGFGTRPIALAVSLELLKQYIVTYNLDFNLVRNTDNPKEVFIYIMPFVPLFRYK